jgi:pilus assembly protein Flp/PilA
MAPQSVWDINMVEKNTMLTNLWFMLQSRLSEEEGQDLVEYALIIALIALACVAGLNTLATAIGTAFTNIGNNL